MSEQPPKASPQNDSPNRGLETANDGRLDSRLEDDLWKLFDAQSPVPQPTSEELVAWLHGELDPAQEELLMERIADSPGAMDRVLAMRRQHRASQNPSVAEPIDADTQKAVSSVMAAISEAPMQVQDPVAPGPSRLPWIAAAVLAMAFAAYTWIDSSEIRRQHQILENRLQVVQGIQVDLQIAELYASSRLRSGSSNAPTDAAGTEESEVRVDLSTSKPSVLILTPQDPIPRAIYGIEILTQKGKSLWQGETSADETGVVVISLPRGFAGPGLARLELTDPTQGVERFGLRFVEPADPEITP